jgi:hypothetical protein
MWRFECGDSVDAENPYWYKILLWSGITFCPDNYRTGNRNTELLRYRTVLNEWIDIMFILFGSWLPRVSVSVPHWFQYGSGSSILDICGSEYGSRSRVWCPNLNKFTAGNFCFVLLWSQIAVYLSLGLYTGYPSHRTSLQPLNRTSSTNFFTIFYFLGHFFPPGSGSGFSRPT